ncbi:hypothetical protein Tco_0683594 [Tanacetum coccineum]
MSSTCSSPEALTVFEGVISSCTKKPDDLNHESSSLEPLFLPPQNQIKEPSWSLSSKQPTKSLLCPPKVRIAFPKVVVGQLIVVQRYVPLVHELVKVKVRGMQ